MSLWLVLSLNVIVSRSSKRVAGAPRRWSAPTLFDDGTALAQKEPNTLPDLSFVPWAKMARLAIFLISGLLRLVRSVVENCSVSLATRQSIPSLSVSSSATTNGACSTWEAACVCLLDSWPCTDTLSAELSIFCFCGRLFAVLGAPVIEFFLLGRGILLLRPPLLNPLS